MANHPSALKRHRQSIKRNARNRTAKSAIWTSTKKVLQYCKEDNFDTADTQLRVTISLYDKAACKGILPKNTAQRRISRLQKRVTTLRG